MGTGIPALLGNMTLFYQFVINQLTDIIDMILGNPLVFAPVLFAIFAGIVMFVIGIVKRLGVRGVSSSGRRRRRKA